MKKYMHIMLQNTKKTVGISSFLFLLSMLIEDADRGGILSASGYEISKRALGTLGIGLVFGLMSFVYYKKNLSFLMQSVIYMGVGCSVMLALTFLLGGIPTDKGGAVVLIAVAGQLLTAFAIWVISYYRQKKLAEKINRKLEQRQK